MANGNGSTHTRGGAGIKPGIFGQQVPRQADCPPYSSGGERPTANSTRGGSSFTPGAKFGWGSSNARYAGNVGAKVGVFTGYTTSKGGSRGKR